MQKSRYFQIVHKCRLQIIIRLGSNIILPKKKKKKKKKSQPAKWTLITIMLTSHETLLFIYSLICLHYLFICSIICCENLPASISGNLLNSKYVLKEIAVKIKKIQEKSHHKNPFEPSINIQLS